METREQPPTLEAALEAVQAALAYRFRDPRRLEDALRILAPPLTPEAAATRQRLEFLGDAAWDCAVAWAACQLWPEASAGLLTRLRANAASAEGMARLARALGLPQPADASLHGPRERVLAELLEAVFGAMMLDGGFARLQELARQSLAAEGAPAEPPPPDPKSALQMLAQAARVRLPRYRLLDRWGPPHQPMFRIEVVFEAPAGEVRATAEGPNRHTAEQEAARRILARLDPAPPPA